MKKAVLLFLVAVFSFSLIACKQNTDEFSSTVCARFSYPGFGDKSMKGTPSAEVLETDSEGRIMFKYSDFNGITKKEETILGIIQRTKSEDIYYYEDVNIILYTRDNVAVETFKKANDWDQELNYDKMSKNVYIYRLDRF